MVFFVALQLFNVHYGTTNVQEKVLHSLLDYDYSPYQYHCIITVMKQVQGGSALSA